MSRRVGQGSPEPLGVAVVGSGVNVAVFSAHATAVDLCLFDERGDRELERVRLPERTGDVFHGWIDGIGEGARYGLRAHGPFAPGEGHRFNSAKLLLDPLARLLDRPFRLHEAMFGYPPGGDDLGFDATDSAPVMPKAIVIAPAGTATHRSLVPWGETILYELHVKGFTKLHPAVPEAVRGTFAGLGQPAAIEHLTKLGVTSVEVLPPAAWIEERHLAGLGLSNYWGYNPVALIAPEPRLAPGGWAEIRSTVAALAEAGIETIVDVVLNHSGEGDALGPTLSLRGLDNASYYRLRPNDPRRYIDDSGCGNTLALDRPPVVRLAMDALRTWVREAGVHGFRFDLATCLGRRDNGFDQSAPLIAAIDQDPELRALKLIAEPWDIGPGGYQLGRFPSLWGEWNDRSRDDVRRFWRGDPHRLGALASRLAGSADLFGRCRPPSRSVNFITAHDGFSLADLVGHEQRRNEANGEENRDGSAENFSWNCGREGDTDEPTIRADRARDQRALLATLLLSRGTPMLSMGAELGHSQRGNNNCYAQDNDLSWLNWDRADGTLLDFTSRLMAIRRTHPLLREDRVLQDGDVSWLTPAAEPMTAADWEAPEGGSLAMVFEGESGRLALLVHRGLEPRRFQLPKGKWRILVESASDDAGRTVAATVDVPARCVLLLAEDVQTGPNRPVSSSTLRRLADKAGVQPVWWSVDGIRHEVGEDTTRHLLRAMHLTAESEGEARNSLDRLSELYERRPLPPVLVLREGELLPVSGPLRIEADDGERVAGDQLVPGRYRLLREDAPDAPCRLTIAPHRAWLPQSIRSGQRLFGIAAQLYSLSRDGDGGIGDFTTLAELAKESAAAGAHAVGINPLHALFGEGRERCSPYSPSDRRFVDPIYLDVGSSAVSSEGELLNYPEVWRVKQAALLQRFARENPGPEISPACLTYATFCALSRHFGGAPWQQWPAEFRDPANAAVRGFAVEHESEVRFHAYLQQLCDEQLAGAAGLMADMDVGLYRDQAVGAAPDGAEAWAWQSLLASDVSIGAPPDPIGPEGQVWNLPPFDPHALRTAGYDPYVELLTANMKHAGALRIDHAMAMSRLFWVPQGAEGKDGAYVSYPFRDMLGETLLASVRARCMVVAEALGTVPEGFGDALIAADILTYRVMLLEKKGDAAFVSPFDYPRLSLACLTSHDLPTFAGWWSGADIREREDLGLLRDRAAADSVRASEKEALLATTAHNDGQADDLATITVEVHSALAAGNSALVMVQAEELALEERAVNVPGTTVERPNWRRRLKLTIEQLFVGTAAAIVASIRLRRPPESLL
ncbi:glycogen debranching protein GlgX [uncultured Sphingomonas sp.]|uniref:glycogen debranching protein GlgX n=1 Tax=uncultured Sphingomonas sp. TaxID=158754 RepID=UPI0025E43C89|nr:glycogen debranching protein GlgX [uncultured Sphingomonas sp.]